MQDSNYLETIEVSGMNQSSTLRDMIKRNSKNGFEFQPMLKARYFRVLFKTPMSNIARVEVLTPKSNVKQIRLSYFDDYNRTIKESRMQDWPVNHISTFGRENNTLDKLCPNFAYRGIQVELIEPASQTNVLNNVTLHVYVRNCLGTGGRIRKY